MPKNSFLLLSKLKRPSVPLQFSCTITSLRMTASEKYCLKVDQFGSSFLDSLRDLRASEDLFDVTLVSDDENPVQAHKLVLSASSIFFKNIFKFNKNNHPLLYIRGLAEKDLKNVLEFLYNGEVQVAHNELDKFLEVAKDLKLKGIYEQENLHQSKDMPNIKESQVKKNPRKTKSKTALAEIKDQKEVKTEDYNFDDISSRTVLVDKDVEQTDISIEATEIDATKAKSKKALVEINEQIEVKTEYNFDDISSSDVVVVAEDGGKTAEDGWKTDASIEATDITNLDAQIECV